MSRSARYALLCLGMLLAMLLAAGSAYWFHMTQASSLLASGRAALQRGEWHLANRRLELLEQHGYADPAHFLRAETWLYQARLAPEPTAGATPVLATSPNLYQRALGELAQIRDEGPLSLEAAVLGAECLVHLGQRPFAAEVLNNVVQRDPDQKEAHRWLVAIHIDLNNPRQAIAHLREWGRLDPHNGRPYRWIGLFLVKDYAQFTEAIAAYREACRRDLEPELRAEVLKELAEALLEGPADYQAALDVLKESPRTGETPELLTLRAQCLWNLAQQTEATQVLEAALRAKPELPQALQLRAKMLFSEGQAKAALPLLETALRLDAQDHVSRQLLMQAYQLLGDPSGAERQRQLLEEARRNKDQLTKLHDEALRHPWDAPIRQQLADLCLKLNRTAEAHMWRRAASACLANSASETTFAPTFSLPERN